MYTSLFYIDYYRDNPLVQKAVKELAAAMPEMEVLGADANQQEALFLIDDATYLHIQPCDSGWDYTLYDAASMKELDGGQLDMPELSRKNAVLQICDDNNLDSTSLRHAPMSMIETLQEAAYQQMQAETSQMTASSQLPEAQEQALDEYPMPDEQVSTPDMQEYGYSYDGMLPVTRERALELDAAGLTVYVLHLRSWTPHSVPRPESRFSAGHKPSYSHPSGNGWQEADSTRKPPAQIRPPADTGKDNKAPEAAPRR